MEIYLDNAATTRIDMVVLDSMLPYLEGCYGNPSSIHTKGTEARNAVEAARKIVASALKAKMSEVVFTSGGTEANNLALKGAAYANMSKGNHIIVSSIEHPSVLQVCKELEKDFNVTLLPVDKTGYIDSKKVSEYITDKTIIVSVMHVNNEIGTIQPIREIYAVCKQRGVIFHTDAAQSFKKIGLDSSYADLITLSGHKIHGPKGVGALFVKQGVNIHSQLQGGHQENELRGGTENVAAIVGFGSAIKQETHTDEITEVRDHFIARVLDEVTGAALVGGSKRACNIANLLFPMAGDSLLLHLDAKHIYVSTGSACTSKVMAPSHVLKTMGFSDKEAARSIRFSLSKHTTKEEIDKVAEELKSILNRT